MIHKIEITKNRLCFLDLPNDADSTDVQLIMNYLRELKFKLEATEKKAKEEAENYDRGLGTCKKCHKKWAAKDYNGCGETVCDGCYESLEREFEDEYR